MKSFLLLLVLILSQLLVNAQRYKALFMHSQWDYNNQDDELTGQFNTPFFTDNPLFYNEDNWFNGRAPLGFNYSGLRTQIADSAKKEIATTYYFLNNDALFLHRANAIDSIFINIAYTDGFVVYLNGAEVARNNVPVLHNSNSRANQSKKEISYERFDISTFKYLLAPLNYIDNIFAVEIHQAETGSDSLYFDMEVEYVVGAGSSPLDVVSYGPYLNLGTPNSAIVRWYTNNPTQTELSYGTDPLTLGQTFFDSTETREHIIQLDSLDPATKYYYQIEGIPSYINVPGTQYFKTSPLPGNSVDTRIWVLGDFGNLLPTQFVVYQDYLRKNAGNETDLWMWLGDNAYDKGTFAEYESNVFAIYPEVLKNHMVWPSLGNHDVESCNTLIDEGPYFDLFSLPSNGEAGGVPSGTEAYYSFNYGDIHFICLESTDNNRMPGGAMLSWLQEDLKKNQAKWTVAFWHHPPYSYGTHNSDTDGRMTQMREQVNPLLERYGVDLVLTGHSHDYERSYLLDGHYGLGESFNPDSHTVGGLKSGKMELEEVYVKPRRRIGNHGTVYAVVGAGGSIYDEGSLDHPAKYYSSFTPGSMILEISGDTLHASYLGIADLSGAEDEFYIIKEEQNLNCDMVIDLGPNQFLCKGDSIQIGVDDKFWTYTWNTGDSSNVIWVTSPGTYTLEVAVFEGCTITSSIALTEPNLTLVPRNDTIICAGKNLVLNANGNFTDVLWSNGSSDDEITITDAGTYVLTGNFGDQCTLMDSIMVELEDSLDLNLEIPLGDSLITGSTYLFLDKTERVKNRVWDFGDGNSSSLDSVYHSYSAAGNYTVEYIAQAEVCRSSKSKNYEVSKLVGLSENLPLEIRIKPNPTQGLIEISANSIVIQSIKLIDGKGVSLKEYQNTGAGNWVIDISEFANGSYWLLLEAGDKEYAKAILKQ